MKLRAAIRREADGRRPATRRTRWESVPAEWDNWRQAKKQYEASTAHVEIDQHCSGDCPMLFVCCGKIRVRRGYVVGIDPQQLQVDLPSRRESLKAFCERFKLPFKEPGWHLVSYWG